MTLAARCFFILSLGTCSAAAFSGELPPIAFLGMGFKEAKIVDFPSSSSRKVRENCPRHCLAETADLTGDGVKDEARLLISKEQNVALIVVVSETSQKIDTYVLEQVPLAEAESLGIRAVQDQDSTSKDLAIVSYATGEYRSYRFDGSEFLLHDQY